MVSLQILRDGSLSPAYAVNLTDAGYTCALLADTATSLAVPAGARIAVFGFSSANDVWVGTATFAIPTGNSFSLTNLYLNPPPFGVSGISTLWLRAPVACAVSVAFYG